MTAHDSIDVLAAPATAEKAPAKTTTEKRSLDQQSGNDITEEAIIEYASVDKDGNLKDIQLEDSPYEDVRAAVLNSDSGGEANTIRAWVLGMFFVTLGSGINMFLSMRNPAISLPSVVALLLAYPMGCFWAKTMPTRVFTTFGKQWTLNPGPFNVKEHAVITIMANVSIGYAYSTDALLALQGKPFYNINLGWGFALLFTLSSQLIGISFAGMFRRFLVWPAEMKWPSQFSITSLFNALHDRGKSDGVVANGWGMSRYRWFVYASCGMFCYYWIPGVLFQALSNFTFPTFIKPDNVIVNQLFGGNSNLSLLPITFDWTFVTAYLSDPLLAPPSAHVNTLIGLIFVVIVPIIGIVYSGALWSDYLPVMSTRAFDNTQKTYKVSKILTPDHLFDPVKYKKYSPLFLSPSYVMNYGINFAALAASFVHAILFHGEDIWNRLRDSANQDEDVHTTMMKKYKEAPDWWYAVLFLGSLGLGFGCTLGFDSQLPWWAFIVSIIIPLLFIIPSTMVLAVSNITIGLNVLSAFIGGYMIPERPIGVMVFKVFSTITLGQAQTYMSDLKLAHYMKIPPRITFWCQIIPTIWASIIQIAVMNWTLGNIDNVCDAKQKDHFTCPIGSAFFTNSIVWGVIGPRRMLGAGSMYVDFNWFWLIGAAIPVVLWVLIKKLHIKSLQSIQAPVIFGSLGWLPPATPLTYFSWAFWGLMFNYLIHNKFNAWWKKYNYITAAALDSGLIISSIVIFLAITFPNVTIPQWWGNVGALDTLDASIGAVKYTVADGETFGPPMGSW